MNKLTFLYIIILGVFTLVLTSCGKGGTKPLPPPPKKGEIVQNTKKIIPNHKNLVSLTKKTATQSMVDVPISSGFTLSSPAVKTNKVLPFIYTCDGLGKDGERGGISPELTISNAPEETISFVVTMHVLKGREKMIESNWVLYNIPKSNTSIPKGNTEIGTLGLSELGENSYFAPCSKDPIRNSYKFTLYALPKMLDLTQTDASFETVTSKSKEIQLGITTLDLTNVRYNPKSDEDKQVAKSVPVTCEEKSIAFKSYGTTTISCDGNMMTVTSKTGLPVRSKLDGDKPNVGIESWIGRVPIPHETQWKVPLNPQYLTVPEDNILIHYPIGVTVDGVPLLHYAKESSEGEVAELKTDYSDRDTVLLGEIDQCGGHAGNGDDYHYHYAPLCMMDTHNPSHPLAYMFDGIPLYFGTAGGTVEGSTSTHYGAGRYTNLDFLPSDVKSGSNPLDECNSYDLNGDGSESGYVYYTTKDRPYTIGCFRGKANQEESSYHYPRWDEKRNLSWSGSGVILTDFYDGQFEGKTWKYLEMIPKDRSRIQDGKIGLVLFRQLSPGEDRYSSTSSCWVFRYRLDSSNITGSDDTIETQCR